MKKLLYVLLTLCGIGLAQPVQAGILSGGGPPVVTLTYPANSDSNVDPAVGTITVNFDSYMDTSSFRDRVSIDNGATIASLSFENFRTQLHINLAGNLQHGTRYTVTIAKQVKDIFNNKLAAAYSFSFTTSAAANDTTPPTVASTSPVAGAVDIAVNAPIGITFSEVMDPATITGSTITVSNGVTGTVALDDTGRTAVFTPSGNLSSYTTYTVTVGTGVEDTSGNALAAPFSWNFRTVNTDNTPPRVTVVTPVSGGTDIGVGTTVTAVFSEAVDPATISTTTFLVNGVTGSVNYDPGTFTATFTPSAPLAYSTGYTATVTTGVHDLAGNAMTSAKTWSFTTIRAAAQLPSNYYCHLPPFVTNSATAMMPNVLLLVDNSGSMYEFAYKAAGTGNNSYDTSYTPGKVYYGYFDSTKMYKYLTTSGGFFQVDTTKAQDNTSFWSGNFLNWLTMRRVDILRKILVGGKTQPRSANTANYLYGAESPDRDYYKSYNSVRYQIKGGSSTEVIQDVTNDHTYSVKIYVGDQPPDEGIIPKYRDKLNFGIMFFNDGYRYEDQRNSVRDGGNVVVDLGANGTNLITQIENSDPETWTPLAESLYEATRYFKATDSAYNGGTYSGKDPIRYPCQKNFVLILTDGESTKDQNLPGSHWSLDGQVSDPDGFNVRTYMDRIASIEGYDSQWGVNANTSDGTYYLEGVSYYAHTTDLRSATVGKSNLSGKQNLTIYTVFAFDDSPIGRDILKKAAKYGGFEDFDNSGRPDSAAKWDKNGDGVPDTFYEAEEGSAIAAQLEKAVRDILARVSSGTAASILSNSEGTGANILQAVFYPKKSFENSEASWIGEMQNLWYYIDPRLQNSTIREDSVRDNILDLRQDKVVQFRFDNGQTVADLLTDSDGDGDGDTAAGTVAPDSLNSLWRAGKLLWGRNSGRTIYTHTADGLVRFTDSSAFDPATGYVQSLLQAANEAEAGKIINFTKGVDQSGYRSRTVTIDGTSGVWKLGDIVSSTPRLQSNSRLAAYDSAPAAGYNDTTYRSFVGSNQYRSRGMGYVGANDGMLHAFKLGALDVTASGSRKAALQGDNLGNEQWSFIPQDVLPYLKYLADPAYNHIYYVDGPTVLLDASIGVPAGCSTDYSLCDKNYSAVDVSNDLDLTKTSWRSVLIGSMGFGGASRKTCSAGANCVQTPIVDPNDSEKGLGYSSYFALDVTDPDNPSLMWEFSNEDLGFSTTGPAIVRIGDRNKNGKWFAIFATGPTGPIDPDLHQFLAKSDKPLKLFVVDLKTGQLLRTIDTTAAPFNMTDLNDAFAGSLIGGQVDTDRWNQASPGFYSDDAVYFGYVKKAGSGDNATWNQGGVMRLLTRENPDPATWTVSKVIDGTGPITTGIGRLVDRNNHAMWLYAGSGRYYHNGDDSSARRTIYGFKDPCYTATNDMDSSCSASPLARTDLTDQTRDDAVDALGVTTGNGWLIDLDAGDSTYDAERIITNPVALTNGTVFFTSFKPTADPCGFGGSSFVWLVKYNTGVQPPERVRLGQIVLQLSTGSFEQVDIRTAFTARGDRRTDTPMPGKPPGDPPPIITNANNKPVKKIMHIQER